jgi:hypothetical protein
MREDIIILMKEIEPNYKEWSIEEINNQIDAILDCGYEWVSNGSNCGFKHKESNVYLNIPGLNFYSPRQIKETYRRTWSKDFNGVKARRHLSETIKGFGILVLTLIVGFIFLSANHALIINGIILTYILFNYAQYRIFSKKNRVENYNEADHINAKAIVWCTNCKNYKKVKNWQRDLYNLKSIADTNDIPCRIYNETKEVWEKHFNAPASERYLYPKNCPSFNKK